MQAVAGDRPWMGSLPGHDLKQDSPDFVVGQGFCCLGLRLLQITFRLPALALTNSNPEMWVFFLLPNLGPHPDSLAKESSAPWANITRSLVTRARLSCAPLA